MATYSELRELFANDDLRQRITTAVIIAAQAQLVLDPGTANGKVWALDALENPERWGGIALKAVLAANESATVANITGATDAQIQTNVNAAVAGFVAGNAGA